jgi:hypothetical protein
MSRILSFVHVNEGEADLFMPTDLTAQSQNGLQPTPESSTPAQLHASIQATQNVAGADATPLQKDDWIYRIVVVTLGATVLLVVVGTFVLAAVANLVHAATLDTPPALIALGSAAVGALGGLLAPSPRQ